MKAIVYKKYGPPDVLEIKDIKKPTPKENEVLVKVHATSVNAADWHFLRADPFVTRFDSGILKPKHTILGADISGQVEAIGKNITHYKPGDDVFGDISECGWGGFAEYVCTSEDALVSIPEDISFEKAASVPMAAVTALQGLQKNGQIRSGQKVLINGATGGVGSFAVQIAKSFGTEVTAVCSTDKMDLVKSLGADHVIDYTRENFTQNSIKYDLIYAANGYHSIFDYKRSLNSGGKYVMSGGSGRQMFQAMIYGPMLSAIGNKKLGGFVAEPCQSDLDYIKNLLETRQIKPVIDRQYPLNKIADAFRYFEEGHARGKIVITVIQR